MSAVLIQRAANGFVLSPFSPGTNVDVSQLYVFPEIKTPHDIEASKMMEFLLKHTAPAVPPVVAIREAAEAIKRELEEPTQVPLPIIPAAAED